MGSSCVHLSRPRDNLLEMHILPSSPKTSANHSMKLRAALVHPRGTMYTPSWKAGALQLLDPGLLRLPPFQRSPETPHPSSSPVRMSRELKKAMRGNRRSWCSIKTRTGMMLGSHRWLMKRLMLP